MSDYNVADVIREARATIVAATQSYTSLIPPMGGEEKAKVFIANMANRITFCAADEDSAKIAADTLGKRKARRDGQLRLRQALDLLDRRGPLPYRAARIAAAEEISGRRAALRPRFSAGAHSSPGRGWPGCGMVSGST